MKKSSQSKYSKSWKYTTNNFPRLFGQSIKSVFIIVFSLTLTLEGNTQIQIGQSIDGSGRQNYFGINISLDQDGNRMAVGSELKVQVFENQSDVWTQIGTDLPAVQNSNGTGVSSMSDDGNIIAVGAPKHDIPGTSNIGAGQIIVYELLSGTWTQIGQELNGASSSWFGSSVSLSSDGTIMVVGSTLADVNGFNSGSANVYELQSGTWTQIGSTLLGIDEQDRFGKHVSISDDGTIIAIAANNSTSVALENSGYVKIFENQAGTWTQLGQIIEGEAAEDYSGGNISLSADGTKIAIGATANDGNGISAGHVRVFEYSSSTWSQVGQDIDGEAEGDAAGSVSMSDDGSRLVIGGTGNDDGANQAGHARVFEFQSGTWVQVGLDIDGENEFDFAGLLGLSGDGQVLGLGEYRYDLSPDFEDFDAGRVRVFGGLDNQPPTVANPLADIVLTQGFGTHVIGIANVFTDTNGDALNYSVSSSLTSVTTASTNLASLTITEGTKLGATEITVTADDGDLGEITNTFTITVEEPDTEAPYAISYSPEDDATGVARDGVYVITFNEEVVKKSGFIRFYNSAGTLRKMVSMAAATIDGATMTIDPSQTFSHEEEVNIRIDAGAVEDLSGNDYAGITDATTWSFTTINAPEVSLNSTAIDENESVGTVVGLLSTIDAEDGETYTYNLVSGTGDTDNGSFTVNGNELRSNEVFDFEVKSTYSVRIYTSDGSKTFAKSFSISINDVSEVPTEISLDNSSIDENEASGTSVGTLSTTDVDAGETYTYTFVTGTGDNDNGSFTIDGSELKSAALFDFETKDIYSVRINTNDGNGGNFAKSFSISINDVSEIPTDISLDNLSIDENETTGTSVGILFTTDSDEGETYIYMLVAGSGDTDNDSFSIDGNELKSAAMFDFETKDTYSVRVNTNDGNGGNFNKSFSISINDVSEIPTEISLDNSSIDENEASGTSVGTLSTTDVDAGETYTYTFVTGTGDNDNGSFSIDGSELKSAAMFDFETKDIYSVRINTYDGNGGNFAKSFSISINDVSEIPTDISLDNLSIDENETTGTSVGILSTTDSDEGETYTYSFASGTGDTDNGSFAIDGDELKSAEMFDFETKETYNVRINTSDGNGGNFEKSFIISVNDVVEFITWNGTAWSNGSGPTASDNALIDGDYSTAVEGDIVANDLTTNSGFSITVGDNNYIEVNGDLIHNGTNLEFVVESGGSLVTKGNVIGDFIIERITTFDENTGRYSVIGPPIIGATSFNVFGSNAMVYSYDETQPYNVSGNEGLDRFINLAEQQNTSIYPGRGYFSAKTGDANGKIFFSGQPNYGPIDVSLSLTDHPAEEDMFEGFNLVSNPYPCAIDYTNFISENSSDIEGAIYIWDDFDSETSRGTNADYVVINAIGNVDSRKAGLSKWDGHIRSMQGFFVQAKSSGDKELDFTDAMKVTANNNDGGFYRISNEQMSFKLILESSEGDYAETLIGMREGASLETDEFDARLFSPAKTTIYSQISGEVYAIQGLPRIDAIEIPVGIKTEGQSTYEYEISIDESENLEGYSIVLKDHWLNKSMDISLGDTYRFFSNESTSNNRFSVLISSPSNILGLEKEKVLVYASNSILYIQQKDDKAKEYQLFNMNGQKLISTTVQSKAEVDLNRYAKGIYLVFDGEKTHKIILK